MQSIKFVLKRLDHVSRATNVSSRFRLGLVSVSSFYVSCPSLPSRNKIMVKIRVLVRLSIRIRVKVNIGVSKDGSKFLKNGRL